MTRLETWNNDPTSLAPDQVAEVFAESYLPSILRPLSREVLTLFREGRAADAKKRGYVHPAEFTRASEYLAWAQFTALFLKCPLEGSGSELRTKALEKFKASESACKRANRRLTFYRERWTRENPVYRTLLDRAAEIIRRTLGNLSENVLDSIIDHSRPGSGIAIGSSDVMCVSGAWKLSEKTRLCCTPDAAPYARKLVWGAPRWALEHASIDWTTHTASLPLEFVDGNRVAFVPKDATTHRTIAVEPSLNVMLQLGVDWYFKTRLRSVGIDLHDQTRNQKLAQKGASCFDTLDPIATLDLAAASDSLCSALVERLLPWDWVALLDDLRSKSYTLDKGASWTPYEKWSSMGNGYTFSLESLIFWALGKACISLSLTRDEIGVYGDDIAIPRSAALLLTEVLRYVGFRVNPEKTHIVGPYRESCGEECWSTTRVVPLYFRGTSRLAPTDIYRALNRLADPLGVVRSLLFNSLRGRTILFGLPGSDDSACVFSTDKLWLRNQGYIKWVPAYQAWRQFVAVYRTKKRQVNVRLALLSALAGLRTDESVEHHWFKRKAVLRGGGKWSTIKVMAG